MQMPDEVMFCDGDSCGIGFFCDIHHMPLKEPRCWKCSRDQRKKEEELKDLYEPMQETE